MFKDESYNIGKLINRYKHKVLLTSFSLKIDFTDVHVVLFSWVQIFLFIDDIT